MNSKSLAIALLSTLINREERRRYMSSYETQCLDELIEIRRLLRARK